MDVSGHRSTQFTTVIAETRRIRTEQERRAIVAEAMQGHRNASAVARSAGSGCTRARIKRLGHLHLQHSCLSRWRCRRQPNTRAVRQPQTPAFGLLVGTFQPLTPPDALNPFVIDEPARISQQRGDLAIAVAAILAGKLNDIRGEPLFVVAPRWRLAVRRPMLSERRAGTTLGDVKFTSNTRPA